MNHDAALRCIDTFMVWKLCFYLFVANREEFPDGIFLLQIEANIVQIFKMQVKHGSVNSNTEARSNRYDFFLEKD